MTRDRGRKAARQGFVSGPPSLLPFLLLGGEEEGDLNYTFYSNYKFIINYYKMLYDFHI